MAQRTDTFDLAALRLTPGEGRRLDSLAVPLGTFDFSGEAYAAAPSDVPVVLDISRMTGRGYSLRLRFEARVVGRCMRCLEEADPGFEVDAREVDVPGADDDDLTSPYVDEAEQLDLHRWARDAFALALPTQLVCRPECAGLCPDCGANLNEAGPDHHHERPPDPRWAKLRELELGDEDA